MALEERLQLPLLLSSGLVLAARQKITRRCCWGQGEGGKVAGHLLEPEARSREDVAAIAASIRTGQDRTRNAPEPEKNGGWLAVSFGVACGRNPVVLRLTPHSQSFRCALSSASAPLRGGATSASAMTTYLVVIQAVGSACLSLGGLGPFVIILYKHGPMAYACISHHGGPRLQSAWWAGSAQVPVRPSTQFHSHSNSTPSFPSS